MHETIPKKAVLMSQWQIFQFINDHVKQRRTVLTSDYRYIKHWYIILPSGTDELRSIGEPSHSVHSPFSSNRTVMSPTYFEYA